ncbi:MAG TPA: CFI-box-CTERM domain-containing protein [Nitrosopumilaceae archaeon]|nr:CFI-box-CTERM domain-containing protein [Nitrosopumilaceae archaeon]
MLHLSSITLAIIPLVALLLIPGIGLGSTAFAQYDIPNMDDFEMPTPEEIEKMMQTQEVSGNYKNSEHGIEVTIPNGWSGMGSDFKDPTTGGWISGFQAMEGGFEANMSSMQNGEFEIIMLSIMDKPEEETTDPPDVRPPSDEFDVDCDVITIEKISVNNKDIMKVEAQCEGDISMKSRMYHYATNEKIISFAYMTSPSSEFDNNLKNFEDSAKTLKIANQVNVSYEIPEDWDVTEAISDARDTTVETITDTAEATEEVLSDTAEATEEMASDISAGIEDATTNGEEGGGCLIATAAFGTELAPQVQSLREIRDNTVMSTSLGAAFMTGFNQLYYSFSPTIADMERENPIFQETVRVFITPMMSSLSLMTLAEDGNEGQVLGLGISVIALNLGLYLAAPAAVGFTIRKRLKSRN